MSAESLDTRNDRALGISDAGAIDSTVPFILGEWRIDPSARCATRNDEVIKIDPRNMRVLQILVERHGQVVSQRELEALAWEGVVVTPDSLYQAIRQLRQALQDTKSPAKYIETVPRRGYRVVAELSDVRIEAERSARDATSSLDGRFGYLFARLGAPTRFTGPIALCFLLAVVAICVRDVSWRDLVSNKSSAATSTTTLSSESRGDSRQTSGTYAKSFGTLRALGHDALRAGRVHEAIEYFKQALSRQMADAGENNEVAIEALIDLSAAYMWADQDLLAREAAAKALSTMDQLGSASSPERVASLVLLADALISLGEYGKAEPLVTEAVALSRKSFGSDHAGVFGPLVSHSMLRFSQGRLHEAEQSARQAIAIATRVVGSQHVQTAYGRNLLSVILLDGGNAAAAEQEARAVLDIASRLATDGPHPYEISATHILAESLLKQGEFSNAEVLLLKELEALETTEGADWRVARAASVLGEVYFKKSRFEDAERYLLLAKSKLTRTKGWPFEREVANLARRLEELDASRPGQVSALVN